MKEHDQFGVLLDHRHLKTADRETLPPDPTQIHSKHVLGKYNWAQTILCWCHDNMFSGSDVTVFYITLQWC